MSSPTLRSRGWRRILWRVLAICALLAVLVTLVAVFALRSPAVRQSILARAASAVEEATGMAITAGDFSWRLSPGTVVLRDVEVRAGAETREPFLTVPEATIRVRWRSLLRGPVLLPSVTVDRPLLDLAAPLPSFAGEPAEDGGDGGRGLDIAQIELVDGQVLGGEVPESRAALLDTWQLDGVSISGSYRSGELDATVTGTGLLSSTRRPVIRLEIAGALSQDDEGLEIDSLTLDHDALSVQLSARQGGERSSLSTRIEGRPAELFPDLTSDGSVSMAADLTVEDGRLGGDVRADVRRLPGELVEPLAALSAEYLALVETELDVDAELDLDVELPGGELSTLTVDHLADRLRGHARIAWRHSRDGPCPRELLEAEIRTLDPQTVDRPLRVAFSAEVMPGMAGRRTVSGELSAPAWRSFEAGDWGPSRIEIDARDLEALASCLGLDPAATGWHPHGEARISARIEGPFRAPKIGSSLRWLVDGQLLVEAELRSPAGKGTRPVDRLRFDVELLPESAGERHLAGELVTGDLFATLGGSAGGDPWSRTRLADTRLELDLPDLAGTREELARRIEKIRPGTELPAAPGELFSGTLMARARLDGPLSKPRLDLESRWRPAGGEDVRLEAHGEVSLDEPFFSGVLEAEVEHFDLARLASPDGSQELGGHVSASLDFEGTVADHSATWAITGENLEVGGGPRVTALRLEARSQGGRIELTRLDGELARTEGTQPFRGHGHLVLAPEPLRPTELELRVELPEPLATLELIAADIALGESEALTAGIALREPDRPERPVATARSSLAALGFGDGDAAPDGHRTVWLSLSDLELDPFLPLVELARAPSEDAPFRPHATLRGDLTLDLDDLLASRGEISASGLALETADGIVTAEEPVRFGLAAGRVTIHPARLLTSGRGNAAVTVAGTLELERGPEGTFALGEIDLELDGTFDTATLDPFLGGGRASGDARVGLRLHGPVAALVAEGFLDAPAAELVYSSPYPTHFEGFSARLAANGGETTIESLQATLNGGTLTAAGRLSEDRKLRLASQFAGVRYRLDHGLAVNLSGHLELRPPARDDERTLLSGEIVVERGALRRDLEIDRQILSLLFAPDLTSTEGASTGEPIELDLQITTAAGVRIKNNLADLRVDWSRLRVRGTLDNPLVSGRLEVDPGGGVTAYGQHVRVDEASLDFSGDPAVGPRLELELTSSRDDPSVRRNRNRLSSISLGDRGPGRNELWDRQPESTSNLSGGVPEGLLDYYADRVAGRLSQGLEHTQLSLEPLPLFGETDTQARLTATQRLSYFADLIYSVNPRDAEGQTYILGLHDLDFAPDLAVQVFNNDEDNEGATVVQTLELGGTRPSAAEPRLSAIRLDGPDDLSRRRLRRVLGIQQGEIFPEDRLFDAELDLIEEMRRRGHYGAEVKIALVPAESGSGQRRDLRVEVEPGPRTVMAFEGEKPPAAARRRVAQLYRPGDEDVALREMTGETVRGLRHRGFLDPRIEIVAEGEDPRTVRIRGEGGERIAATRLTFEGLDPGPAELVASRFASRLARVELAAGIPGADLYLEHTLKSLGYPEARITSRKLSKDGDELTVTIEPGPRQVLARLDLQGVVAEEAERLRKLLPIVPGAPLRTDAITRSAHLIEDALRERGFADARVRTRLEDAGGGPRGREALELDLSFDVETGPPHRLAEVRFEGLRSTRVSWARHVAGLEDGETFSHDELGDARRRLVRTGLFERVRAETTTTPSSSDEGAPVETTIVFDVQERPRYRVAYGGRWESGEGFGAVVEAVDTNFLGRGTTLGGRAIQSEDEKSLRLYHAVPRVGGTRGGLELFLEGKDEELEGSSISSVESWTQYTFPLGRRFKSRVYLRYQDLFVRSLSAAGDTPDRRFAIPSLGWQLNFDNREPSIDARPSDGLVFGLDLSGSDSSLGSDVSILGLFSQLKLFRTFARERTRDGLTWAQWWRLGLLESSGAVEIPTVNRLRAGGEYSVRGYRRNSLGPLDAEGNSLGGEAFFLINQELHFPVWSDYLSGVAFFDAGNVWASRDDVDFELVTSVGVGVRASTPIGPLRLDVAFPLDRREGDEDFRVYVGFGNIF